MTDDTQTLSEREEIELLLPWYATGRLEPSERARVDAWAARDPAIAAQLRDIEDDRVQAVHSNEAYAVPPSVTVQRAMARIIPQRQVGLQALIQHARALLEAPTPRLVGWAASAAAIVIVAQAVWIGSLISNTAPAVYQTASGEPVVTDDGAFALVRFNDTATIKDIAAALVALDMRIADGPRSGGLFRVRIGNTDLAESARKERIAALQRLPGLTVLVTPTR